MHFAVGDFLAARNETTLEEWNFHVIDVFDYDGRNVVYGESMAHQIWLPARALGQRTRIDVAARAGAFPIIPTATEAEVVAFVQAVGGGPLSMAKRGEKTLVINAPHLQGFTEEGIDREIDSSVRQTRKLIDLFDDWLKLKRLPFWYRDLQSAAASGKE